MLELREYETRRVPLTATQAAELAGLTRGTRALDDAEPAKVMQMVLPTGSPGLYDVQPGSYVGRFALISGLVIDVASRFDFDDLLEVLRVAARLPSVVHDAPVPTSGGRGIVELVALAFVREVERIVGFGIAKGYVQRTFTRPPYPGVPDATAHLARHLGRPDRLVTRARRLTTDVPVNQVLAAALRLLLAQQYRDGRLAARLRALGPVFRQVTVVADALAVARSADRGVPVRYRAAHTLAVLVLKGRTTLPAGTGTAGASVLFAMPKVWEDYVQTRLAEQLSAGHRLVAQHPVLLTDDPSAMVARADLVELGADGSPVAVVDAKYKEWAAKPGTGDLYQTVTYAQRLGVEHATLVYPGRGQRRDVVVGRVRLTMLGLDVLASKATGVAAIAPSAAVAAVR